MKKFIFSSVAALALIVPAVSFASTYTFCANENQTCAFTGTSTVRYGIDDAHPYAYQTLSNGTVCSNGVFGDPVVGTVKKCWTEDSAPAPVFTPSVAAGPNVGTIGGGYMTPCYYIRSFQSGECVDTPELTQAFTWNQNLHDLIIGAWYATWRVTK